MVWPKHDAVNEYYLDIGTHLIEKHGLFLDRYVVWENLETGASRSIRASAFILLTLLMSIIL